MKSCSYCGKQYGDDVEVCPLDEHSLVGLSESGAPVLPARVACPQCGAADDYTPVVELRGSFSLLAFLFGGLFAVLFRNAGRPRRVRCNKCDARFQVSSPFSKISRVIFWLLITPTIIVLILALIAIIHTLFSS